jgi:putative transposase
MPWKTTTRQEQRFDLVRQMIAGRLTVTQLCQRFRISRQTAYKWRARYRRHRLGGLQDRSRRPRRSPGRTLVLWRRRLRRWRRSHPTWGARKLQHELQRRFGGSGTPSVATIGRWLQRWGLSRGRTRRRRGPVVLRRTVRAAGRCHEVWTVDFKGWYRTAAGTRVEPLTVRDLHSRYGLAVTLLRTPSIAATRREFRRLFARHGLPERIRCDNGSPFGGGGPTGLTRLSAWWIKLGIAVEFITPGRPCENGAHEQFHRVYKAEVAARPERTVKAQQRRSERWLRHYNEERPHEALGMKRPVELFARNRRHLPRRLRAWPYPPGWERCWVKGSGEINWCGVRRFVGEAFVRDYVGLKPVRPDRWRVYFGPVLVGELHEKERGSIRMATHAQAG